MSTYVGDLTKDEESRFEEMGRMHPEINEATTVICAFRYDSSISVDTFVSVVMRTVLEAYEAGESGANND